MLQNRDDLETPTSAQLLRGLWPLLWIGKAFGLIPLERSSSTTVSFSYRSLAWILSMYSWSTYFIIFIFAVIIFLRELQGPDTNLVEQFLDMVYHLHITATITFCIYESRNFPELLAEWTRLEDKLTRLESLTDFESCRLKFKTGNWRKKAIKIKFNKTLPFYAAVKAVKIGISDRDRDPRQTQSQSQFVLNCWFLIGGYLGLTVIGAIAYFVGIGIRQQTNTFSEYLIEVAKVYILEEHCVWWTGFYVLIVGHIMEVAWAYGDMLIFNFSFAMKCTYLRFNNVLEIIQANCCPTSTELEQLRSLHWELASAVKSTDARLGLITTTTFVCNILYLFSRVYLGLAEDLASPNPMIVFEASYAFIYLIIRIFGSALYAAKLNDESSRTLVLLNQFARESSCSEKHYLMMDRFSTQIITGNVALSGNGYFTLNRNFIASLISAIITYEVIIIQFSAS